MKKNIFALTLALAMAVSLTACGGGSGSQSASSGGNSSAAQSTPSGASSEAVADVYAFQSNGKSVQVNANMADVLTDIGEPLSYFEAESCAFEGLDKTYTYPGFTVTTRPEGDKDFVNSILLNDDSVTTPEGVYIGSSRADVIAAYGEGTDLGASISYTKGDSTLNFIFDGDKVISIEYLPVV